MRSEQECPAAANAVFTMRLGRQNPADIVQSRLRESMHPELRGICCSFHEGALTLRGQVSSFYQIQLAQSLAAQIPGVEEVVNRIEVKENTPC